MIRLGEKTEVTAGAIERLVNYVLTHEREDFEQCIEPESFPMIRQWLDGEIKSLAEENAFRAELARCPHVYACAVLLEMELPQ